ncbi:hypothetical protein G9U51_13630 [Calidifontibacter sp. DB0510]|uniref:Uncharacterized protein n=1 Tax=Metallococcus carri TaxID=1656884 RepID=A0A967B3X4_9MICO|nr:hypothetical protein [Metallococcus carri]NHN56815.1 hypothetical protein [Metallococcus carri]NOP37808.1 hypothetical protein [Calidifontibacter sp. DB2511S]
MAWSDISPAVRSILNAAVERQLVVQVRGIAYSCWRCALSNEVPLLIHLKGYDRPDEYMRTVASEPIVAYAKDLLTLVGHPAATSIKPRRSRTAQQRYLSLGCLKCDALFGSFPLEEEATSVLASDGVPSLPILAELTRPELEWHALELT